MFKKISIIVTLLALILWIGGYGIFISNIIIKITPQAYSTLKKTDAIIVLTGGNDRIKMGLNLFANDVSNNLFISGVNPFVNKANIIDIWKGDKALPNCCIILGHSATTTIENAIETNIWISDNEIKSIRLVTSAYHMNRALLEFKNKIKNIEIIPHNVEEKRSLNDIKLWKIAFSEYNKFLFRYVCTTLEGY